MEDAEFFLPSEIARLVYGHFKAMECDDLSAKFLNESAHLSECRELQKRNRTFKTEANGLPLKEILDQYLNMNKLILGTVNKLVGDQRKFTDPVEAFVYLLSNNSVGNKSSTNEGVQNQDSPERYSSSSSEDMCSDFSLNLKTPDKHKSRHKVTKNKSETVIELNNTIDRITQETTPETSKPPSRPTADSVIRHSSRLQLKKSLKNDRSCNSDSIKELRLNSNDSETPCKVGDPPYSENKVLKPKTPLSFISSDSEPEPLNDSESSVVNTPSSPSFVNGRVNGLFSPEARKTRPSRKKTLKVLRPRRPPTVGSDKRSGEKKSKCKRNRVSTKLNNSSDSKNENKKSKLSCDISQLTKDTENQEKTQRSSDEFVFTTDGPQTSEKPKARRKSGSMLPINKSLPMIDDVILGEKFIKNTKIPEHIAANINECIMNSPLKNFNDADNTCLEELIKNSLNKLEEDPYYREFESEVIAEFFLADDFASRQTSSDINSVEYPGNEATETTKINDQPLLNSQVTVEIEDQLINNTGNVESQQSLPENENPAIVIKVPGEQIANQGNYVEKPIAVSEELRNYFSNITGLESSPDGKFNSMKTEQASVINIVTSTGEISESCKVGNDSSERILLNSDPVLFPINDGIPVVFSNRSDYQICGTPTPISRINRNKMQYVAIAPKPNITIQLAEEAIGNSERGKRKRRTRGGKRS